MPHAACRLYLITPPLVADLVAFAGELSAAVDAGDISALQIRLQNASDATIEAAVRALAPICRKREVTLILNDRPDLAARLDCDGVHIGQTDAPLGDARAMVGKDRLVGVTCHDSRHLAMDAAEGGADYVAFGAFYPTTTKATIATPDPDVLSIWQESMLIPCVAIGGITAANCRPLVAAGADFLAVSAGVWAHPEGPAAAVRAFDAAIAAGMRARNRAG